MATRTSALVVAAKPLGVRPHADADEADTAVAEELCQRAGDAVGVEELEDEAASLQLRANGA